MKEKNMTDRPNFPEWKPWGPSIHCPRWASRLTLVVTAVKIERLQKISVEDEQAEGLDTTAEAFDMVWDHLYGPGSWNANPEVVALTFEVHKKNIDQMGEADGR